MSHGLCYKVHDWTRFVFLSLALVALATRLAANLTWIDKAFSAGCVAMLALLIYLQFSPDDEVPEEDRDNPKKLHR